MERRNEELTESAPSAPQTIKGRMLNVVDSARSTAAAKAATATAMARNPLGMAIGSVAVGFLAGMLLPVTKMERERVGPLGERLSDNAKAAAASAIEESKTAVSMVIDDALNQSGSSRR